MRKENIRKIVIDARLYGLEHAGPGRYVKNLVDTLGKIDKSNERMSGSGGHLPNWVEAHFEGVGIRTKLAQITLNSGATAK